jgi:hypothetical protein
MEQENINAFCTFCAINDMSVSETNRVNDKWWNERDVEASIFVEGLSREFPLRTEEKPQKF